VKPVTRSKAVESIFCGAQVLLLDLLYGIESERIILRMPEGVQLEVHIQIRPAQMKSMKQLNVENGTQCRPLKPGVQIERQEEFLSSDGDPKPVLRDMDNLNGRCGAASNVR
jgi:hypothetical protein